MLMMQTLVLLLTLTPTPLPPSPQAEPLGPTTVTVSWLPPPLDNGAAITGYAVDLQHLGVQGSTTFARLVQLTGSAGAGGRGFCMRAGVCAFQCGTAALEGAGADHIRTPLRAWCC